MNQQEFGEKLQKDIAFVYDADRYEIEKIYVKKITGNYEGLKITSISDGYAIAVNLDKLYRLYEKVGYENALQEAFNYLGTATKEVEDACSESNKIKDWEYTKNLLKIDIVPESAVTDGAVTYDWMNLKVIIAAEFENKRAKGRAVISEKLRELWNISKAELWAAALESSPKVCPAVIENINEVVFEEVNIPEELKKHLISELPPVYAVTNEKTLYGASAILYPGMLKKISNLMEGSFYFNFSSRHEALIQPNFLSIKDMKKTLIEANEILDKKDFMNNSLYFYDAARGQISEV